MTELVALLSTGKGTWGEVARLIKSQSWERVFLVTDSFGEKFTAENVEVLVVNFNESVSVLRDKMCAALNGKIKGLEVAVNLASGDGKEHMALLGALIKMGVGLRIVAMTEKGCEEV